MWRIVDEFRAFAMRGNVVDLAVGVVIGGAFGKIVSSLVENIITPLLSLVTGGIDFSKLAFTLKDPTVTSNGTVTEEAIKIGYGVFLQSTIDFLIVAFAIFAAIKVMNRLHRRWRQEQSKPVELTKQEQLLTEIRDTLKGRDSSLT